MWSLLGTSRHDEVTSDHVGKRAIENVPHVPHDDGESSDSEGSEFFCPIEDNRKQASRAALLEDVARLENRVRAYQVELKLLNVLRLQAGQGKC